MDKYIVFDIDSKKRDACFLLTPLYRSRHDTSPTNVKYMDSSWGLMLSGW